MNYLPILLALLGGIMAFLGSKFALKHRDDLHLTLAFSGGAIMGVALFHLLPEAIEMTGEAHLPLILAAVGFAAIMAGDQLFSLHDHDDCDNPRHGGNFSAIAITLHGLMDGLAIGLAFLANVTLGFGMAAAILAHKFSDGVSVSAAVLKNDPEKTKTVRGWAEANVAAPVIGAILAILISPPQVVLGPILAVFAGFFLYIGGSDLIPESHHRHPAAITTIMALLGMATILLVSKLMPCC